MYTNVQNKLCQLFVMNQVHLNTWEMFLRFPTFNDLTWEVREVKRLFFLVPGLSTSLTRFQNTNDLLDLMLNTEDPKVRMSEGFLLILFYGFVNKVNPLIVDTYSYLLRLKKISCSFYPGVTPSALTVPDRV